MKHVLTPQQRAIVGSLDNLTVNAVAGSGKTSTLIAYAGARPPQSRILYLAFNRVVRDEARARFAAAGLRNVEAETAHSLAHKYIIRNSAYKVNAAGYKPRDLIRILQLPTVSAQHGDLIMANHLRQYFALFCNSAAALPEDVDYAATLRSNDARNFVRPVIKSLQKQVGFMYALMDRAEIEVTHDYYLKKFQQQCPALPYDYILFDEGQDASEAMLDVFLKQTATKLIVGDTHQQIYSWRYAVNSLERTGFPSLPLNQSFRFNESIAGLAMDVLRYKAQLPNPQHLSSIQIEGLGKEGTVKSKAILARTNLGLLLSAIDYINSTPGRPALFFEGHLSSYTYATDGASLYDVLNMYNRKRHRIRDPLLAQLSSFEELLDYVKATGDAELTMMVKIVEEYGNRIPGLLQRLRDLHVEHDGKSKADIIFSTVHRAKGMEYDEVSLAKDFITASTIRKLESGIASDDRRRDPVEEINLLYVAITRARFRLRIPEALLPEGYVPGVGIEVIRDRKHEPDIPSTEAELVEIQIENRLWQDEIRRKAMWEEPAELKHAHGRRHVKVGANASADKPMAEAGYQPWTFDQDQELIRLYRQKRSTSELATHFRRSEGAIRSRIRKLDLERIYDDSFAGGRNQ